MNTLISSIEVLIILGAIAILLWQRRLNGIKNVRHGLEETLVTSRQLFGLAIALQQHRGMSSAWLSGDASFLPALRAKQAVIENLFTGLLHDARRESACRLPCFTRHAVSLLRVRWHAVLNALADKQAEQSIAQHGHLIMQLLGWLALLGERRIESQVPEAQIGRVRNYSQRLPLLSECLGQARAIGSSVAVRHACSPLARVRLMFLIGRAEALLVQALQANDEGRVAGEARLAIRHLVQTVRTEMLHNQGVSLSPAAYFAVASQAVDSVVAWMECSHAVLRDLARQNDEDGVGILPLVVGENP